MNKKKISIKLALPFISVFLVLIIIFIVFPMWRNAQEIGEKAGAFSGNMVGSAIGSFTGITEKFPEGWDKGKEEGLSAKDTKVELKNTLTEVCNLEVLVAGFKLNNYHQVGDKYAALYLLKANAVFTVDLSQSNVNISDDNKTLFITLPQPDITVYFDENSIEKAEEYQRKFFNGNAEDGFDAYINSMENIESSARLSIQNDESFMQSARDSAEKQIRQIASGVCLNNEKIEVLWD